MGILRKLVAEGKTVLLITHKLKEIKEVADTCTVLRRGRLVGTVAVAGTSEARMAEMMVGREVNFHVQKGEARPGEVVLRIEQLDVRNAKGLLGVRNLGLEVRAGEILGICGIDGNGQTELIRALAGLSPLESGRILFKGQDLAGRTVKQRSDAGVGHIPEDRHKHGLILDFRLDENFVVHSYGAPPFCRAGILDFRAIRANAERLIAEFDVRCGQGGATPARAMSGGNQQKAILAREIDLSPDLLIVAQPTRGLDVGAIETIHRRIIAERDKGRAILLVSLELDEVLDLSDRIAVLCGGELAGVVDARATDENELGLMMAGSGREA